jgi:hypothetical protein
MFVYIWKDKNNIPFYVGLTKRIGRTNPRNSGNRNWLCNQKIKEIGLDHIVIEIRHIFSIMDGQSLERKLIEEYGRIQLGNGTLTNLREGGSGTESMSFESRKKLSNLLKDPNHPIRSKEAREKHAKRMRDPDVKAKFSGDNNPSKRPDVREKLLNKWQDAEYKEKQRLSRTGLKRFSEEEKEKRRIALLDKDHPLNKKAFHNILNSDPNIKAKRVAALRDPDRCKKHSETMKRIWAERKKSIACLP